MTAERVARPVGDEAYVVVELDLGAGEEAAGFLRLLEAQGWSSRDRVPALAGPPRTRLLEAARSPARRRSDPGPTWAGSP